MDEVGGVGVGLVVGCVDVAVQVLVWERPYYMPSSIIALMGTISTIVDRLRSGYSVECH